MNTALMRCLVLLFILICEPLMAEQAESGEGGAVPEFVGNLWRQPAEGKLIVEFDLSRITGKTEASVSGITFYENSDDTKNVSLEAGYGLSDEITLGFGTEYAVGEANSGSGVREFSGMSDPAVGINWQRENTGTYYGINLTHSPSIGDGEYAGTDKDGNNLRGGSLTSATLALGKNVPGSSFALTLGYSIYGEQTHKYPTGEKEKTDTDNGLSVSAVGALLVNPKFAVFGGIVWEAAKGSKETAEDGTTTKYKNNSYIFPAIGIEYGVEQNLLLAIALATAQMEADLDVSGTSADLERKTSVVAE